MNLLKSKTIELTEDRKIVKIDTTSTFPDFIIREEQKDIKICIDLESKMCRIEDITLTPLQTILLKEFLNLI